jgi:hypothetical protein
LSTWLSGEVVAAYAAIVFALQPELTNGTAPPLKVTWGGWLVVEIVFAGLQTWLGGWSKVDDLTREATKELAARTLHAGVAFAIWSFVVPGAWWIRSTVSPTISRSL